MANEIDVNIVSQLRNGNLKDDFKPGNVDITQAASGHQSGTVTVTSTAQVTIGTSNISTLGWCHMRNLDPTNYFEWGPNSTAAATGILIGRCEAGEPAAFRLKPGVTLKAIANTASVKVDIHIWED